jgi:hypothetical protein
MSTTDPNGATPHDDEPSTDTGGQHVAGTSETSADAGSTRAYESLATEPAGAESVDADAASVDDTVVPAADPVTESAPAVDDGGTVPGAASYQDTAAPAAPETIVVQEQSEYVAPVPNDAYPERTPIYIQAPTPPVAKGNRGFGILVGLLATAVFALVYALVSYLVSLALGGTDSPDDAFVQFLGLPVFYVPIIFFFAGFALIAAIINRAGWWSWVLGGFFVAVLVYFSYIGASLLTVQAWNMTPNEAARFVNTQWTYPLAIASAIIAREVPIWFGKWIAGRGRRVTERNAEARAEYDRKIAEGPVVSR